MANTMELQKNLGWNETPRGVFGNALRLASLTNIDLGQTVKPKTF